MLVIEHSLTGYRNVHHSWWPSLCILSIAPSTVPFITPSGMWVAWSVHVLLWVCYSIISFSESNALLTLSKAQIISTGVHGHGACRVCCREFHQSVNSCLSGEIELKSESLEYKLILAQDGSRVSKMAHFERKVRESEASPCLCSCRGKRGRRSGKCGVWWDQANNRARERVWR